jgi:predicted amidophosphoribosyltransferase
MNKNKKEVAQEVPVQERPIKVRCSNCCIDFEVSKICPTCKRAYEEECNYCGNCGTKLVDII